MTCSTTINNSHDALKSLKVIVLFYSLIFLPLNLNGQEKITLYYNQNLEITKKDKASYYREAEFDLNTLKLNGSVRDYYLNSNPLMEGFYSSDKKNGDFRFFYENGNLKSKGKYLDNSRIGLWIFYYPNSKLMQSVIFPPVESKAEFSVGEFYDKVGNQLIINGTGKWTLDSIEGGSLDKTSLNNLTGQFKDSLMTGVWKLTRTSDNFLIHSERFRKGRFIDATVYEPLFNSYGTTSFEMLNKFPDENYLRLQKTESFIVDTTVFSSSLIYQDVETIFRTITGKEHKIKERPVSYPQGDYSLLEFIGQNINYPISAIEKRISGKVHVSVVVDSLGRTKEVRILKGLNNELDVEAIRVVKLIKEWLPAIQNGRKIESTISIPVKFEIK
jgi:TonB family protein